jgi:hypothetical protein
MYRPLPQDDTPEWVRSLQKKEERAVALYEDPGCDALSRSSIREFTKTDRTLSEIQADDAAFYDRYER